MTRGRAQWNILTIPFTQDRDTGFSWEDENEVTLKHKPLDPVPHKIHQLLRGYTYRKTDEIPAYKYNIV